MLESFFGLLLIVLVGLGSNKTPGEHCTSVQIPSVDALEQGIGSHNPTGQPILPSTVYTGLVEIAGQTVPLYELWARVASAELTRKDQYKLCKTLVETFPCVESYKTSQAYGAEAIASNGFNSDKYWLSYYESD